MTAAPASPVRVTPLVFSQRTRAWLKLENLQQTGSFKLRGAWRKLRALDPEARSRGVITASAGNHGAGVALAAAELGISARIVVPRQTPEVKRRRALALGAELVVVGRGYDEAAAHAASLAAERGTVAISAYDDDEIIAGNGESLAHELLAQWEASDRPRLQRVVCPVGGGGLVGGLARVLAPRGIRVVGAQPAANCAMYRSRQLGRALTDYTGEPTVAEGCEGAVAERTFRLVEDYDVELVLVSEPAIEQAVADTYRGDGQIIECSAAVAVAAASALDAVPGETAVVISGGNIDDGELARILAARS